MATKNLSLTEDQEAILLADFLRIKGLLFTHIANESGLASTGKWGLIMKKKRMGLTSGYPDYCVCIPAKDIHSPCLIFIELKRTQGSHVSEEQKQWINTLNAIPNVSAVVCKGAREAIKHINQFL